MKARIVTVWVNGSAWRVEKGKQGYRSQPINGDAEWHRGIPPGAKQAQIDQLFKRVVLRHK